MIPAMAISEIATWASLTSVGPADTKMLRNTMALMR
jgi:hypothetical protein